MTFGTRGREARVAALEAKAPGAGVGRVFIRSDEEPLPDGYDPDTDTLIVIVGGKFPHEREPGEDG